MQQVTQKPAAQQSLFSQCVEATAACWSLTYVREIILFKNNKQNLLMLCKCFYNSNVNLIASRRRSLKTFQLRAKNLIGPLAPQLLGYLATDSLVPTIQQQLMKTQSHIFGKHSVLSGESQTVAGAE